MKRLLIILSFISIGLFFSSCSIEPSPINYGKDACSFCKMNIVDKQHGAELVTKKGKVYKFDAIECLLHDIKKRDQNTIALYLVNSYDLPIELKDATTQQYLISEAIPSPMGANLSAFNNDETAAKTHQEKGGELYNWKSLKEKFGVK